MEQSFTPEQYFFMTLFAMFVIMYVAGLYLTMNDKYEARKERRYYNGRR